MGWKDRSLFALFHYSSKKLLERISSINSLKIKKKEKRKRKRENKAQPLKVPCMKKDRTYCKYPTKISPK